MIPALWTGLAGATLLTLSWQDLRRRRLPNFWVAIYALCYFAFAAGCATGWTDIGWHVAAAAATFAVTTGFFALGWLGGGDVKLWSAVMLWAGPGLALPVVVIATVVGALVGVAGRLAQWAQPRVRARPARYLLRLLTSRRGVPYGVGLAVAGLFVLTWESARCPLL